MRRSLFLTVFLRVMAALAIAAIGFFTIYPAGHWDGDMLLLACLCAAILLAGGTAMLLTRSVHRALAPLQVLAETMPEEAPLPENYERQRYSDFDGLARAMGTASTIAQGSLMRASESRHELEALLDSMQDAVVAVDQAGRIQWTNQKMQRLIPGSSISSAVRVGHALVQTVRDPEVLGCVKVALEQREVCERRTTTMMPGRIFEVNASPMPGGGAVAVLHDITRIEEVERTQRDFVANVSHELRTPLTSISGYVETLLDHERSLSPQAREFLSTILKNATRMSRLTEDLLTMARVESREAEMHPEPVRADVLVQDAVQAMRGLVQDEGALLEIGETTPAKVFADSDAVLQVLGNLIENGVKYGKGRNAAKSRVVVSAREVVASADGLAEYASPGTVEFSVQDFGQGIASEHLTRIFERFYRVDKARSRESGGTGLGLAIARHMVESQGGTIRAESELNEGSTFLVTLPRALPPL
jgi:two-component system, OmpR family, phosphate regulon sensor histidine kinase PhoR